jgi:uncharacterized membrane protein YebE (DUF533 family)
MTLPVQDALIYLMVVAASSDSRISTHELGRIDHVITEWPVFAGYDHTKVASVANAAIDLLNGTGLDSLLEQTVSVLPKRLHDTAYALVVEITAVDLTLEQEELRFLEMLRDQLELDRLTTAAIEAGARARARRLNQ